MASISLHVVPLGEKAGSLQYCRVMFVVLSRFDIFQDIDPP